ncbi:MAG: hypothetical protein ACFE9S_15785 [Candidatus Hermodarchaeota archaeon]
MNKVPERLHMYNFVLTILTSLKQGHMVIFHLQKKERINTVIGLQKLLDTNIST